MSLVALKTLPHTVVLDVADFYNNPAWGRSNQPSYVNTLVLINTRLTPFLLLHHCQILENNQGRVRKTKWGPRVLDIDILTYGTIQQLHPKLTIPHPFMHLRDFVQTPLKRLKETSRYL